MTLIEAMRKATNGQWIKRTYEMRLPSGEKCEFTMAGIVKITDVNRFLVYEDGSNHTISYNDIKADNWELWIRGLEASDGYTN